MKKAMVFLACVFLLFATSSIASQSEPTVNSGNAPIFVNQEIVDYIILKDDDQDDIIDKVKAYISRGYQPWGGLNVIVDSHNKQPFESPVVYIQVMVKYR